jgi:hypothetical protein
MVFKQMDNCVVDYILRYLSNPLIKFAMKNKFIYNPKSFHDIFVGCIVIVTWVNTWSQLL